MTTPGQLRRDLHALRATLGEIRDLLTLKAQDTTEPGWGMGGDCAKAAQSLDTLLRGQSVPEHYKVAVVGRFKAGKSSFVNELLGARVAGEDTSPETAAVTTFIHGSEVRARIRFISAEEWEALRVLHAENPDHADAHRMRRWRSFEGKAPEKTGGKEPEAFDLAALETDLLRPGGHEVEIVRDPAQGREGEKTFRQALKQFTSGSRPHHALVESIEITHPAPLLEEGITLVDTPGLDDTERFRVMLTENAVKQVDAVLFLTQSGIAYGQSEKDFILTLLRRGTVRQLIVAVTQVDKTYDQHLDAARDNDEDPDPLEIRIQAEEQRVRQEIASTLTQMDDRTPATQAYLEQLGGIALAFTSVRLHRDWKDRRPVAYGILPADPGGIGLMQEKLLALLAGESRLAAVAQQMASDTRAILDDLLGTLRNRRMALLRIKDWERAEQRLAAFRRDFESGRDRFEAALRLLGGILVRRVGESRDRNQALIEVIVLHADRELGLFEAQDMGRHWKARRAGHWGHLRNLQAKAANRIFPRVKQLLSDMSVHFTDFVTHFQGHVSVLSDAAADLAAKLELGAAQPFDLSRLSGSFERSLVRAHELIAAEEQRIVSFLDDFVTEEISGKITAARERVSQIGGKSITGAQSAEVKAFYDEARRLLEQSLSDYLQERSRWFGAFLIKEAERVCGGALAEVKSAFTAAEKDIQAVAAARGGAWEAFQREFDQVVPRLTEARERCMAQLTAGEPVTAVPGPAAIEPPLLEAQAIEPPTLQPLVPQAAASAEASPPSDDEWIEAAPTAPAPSRLPVDPRKAAIKGQKNEEQPPSINRQRVNGRPR